MEIYVDTANEVEINHAARYGFLDGITTNPSIIAKENEDFASVIKKIDQLIEGKVWCQVTETEAEKMYQQGLEMSKWAKRMVVKLPMTEEGLEAAYRLKQNNLEVNMTLIYSLSQVVFAAKANVSYISPYIGRMDDHTSAGLQFIAQAKEIITGLQAETKIIGASIRSPQVVVELAKQGIDAVTLPFAVYKQMFHSPITRAGLEQFDQDWQNYQKRIKE